MRIIFVGGYPPKHLKEDSSEWGGTIDNAAYAFQAAIVAGLDLAPADLRVISTLYISTYPKSSKKYLEREVYSHTGVGECKDVFTGFVNLPIIKRMSVLWRTYRELRRLVNNDDETVIVNYALSSDKLLPIIWFRRKFKKTCCIIPDLPEFMSDNNNLIFRLGKKIDRYLICYCIKKFDSFALLSPFMKERLPINDKPWILLEGVYNPTDQVVEYGKRSDGKKVIFYSGALNIRYGIGDLVDAFRLIIHDDYELWFCGSGDAVSLIEENASRDSRIKYLGIASRNDVLKMQRQATLLVNPRHKTEEYTKYSFPSKTMEYMASATPVVMSHLPSIPSDYDAFLYYFEDETPKGMAQKIVEVCNKPEEELRQFGIKASQFIMSQKNSTIQAKRLYDLLSK